MRRKHALLLLPLHARHALLRVRVRVGLGVQEGVTWISCVSPMISSRVCEGSEKVVRSERLRVSTPEPETEAVVGGLLWLVHSCTEGEVTRCCACRSRP